MRQKVLDGTLGIPPDKQLPGTNEKFPYFILGDEAFPLTLNLLIPYPGAQCRGRKDRRIFNYRLSRARRCSENAFGVLGARFQVYRSPLRYDPDNVEEIVWATICLHNLLRSQVVGRAMYTPVEFIDVQDELTGQLQPGEWRQERMHAMNRLIPQGGNRHRQDVLSLRDKWCQYFNGIAAVAWQEKATR